jgi:hypothetical protein
VSLPPLYDESDYEALREEKDARIAGLEAAYNDVVAVNENELALRLEAEAALAELREAADRDMKRLVREGQKRIDERDRMLAIALKHLPWYQFSTEHGTESEVLADLKARAEEGGEG